MFLALKGGAAALFNGGLIGGGILSLLFAIGLRWSILWKRFWGRLGVASLVLGSVALCAIGLFPRNLDVPHDSASLAFFWFIPLALFMIGGVTYTESHKILGFLTMVGAGLSIGIQLIPWPWSGGALPQMFSCFPWMLWSTVFAAMLLVQPRRLWWGY